MRTADVDALRERVRLAQATARRAIAVATESRDAAFEVSRAARVARRRRWTIRYQQAFIRKSVELRSDLDVDITSR